MHFQAFCPELQYTALSVQCDTFALRENSEKKIYLNMVYVYFFPLIVILVNNFQYLKTRFLLFSVQPRIWVPH